MTEISYSSKLILRPLFIGLFDNDYVDRRQHACTQLITQHIK